MSSTRTRIAAATAVSVTALSGVALAAPVASAHTHGHHAKRINTHLSINAARRETYNGQADAIGGHLGSNGHRLVNQKVVLQDKLAGSKDKWAALATDTTNKHGNVWYTVTPTAKTRYRLVYGGNGNFQPSKSKVVTIGIRNTALSIKASSTSVDKGAAVTVSGVLDANGAPAAGQTVALRDRLAGSKDKKFALVGAQTTGADGSVSFSVSPDATTQYKLTFAKNGDLQAAHSRVIKVVVRSASSLSSRIRGLKKGFAVSGELRGAGHVLNNRKVTLLDSTDNGVTWTAVKTKRTDKNGFVSYRVNPATTTEYELAFAGGRYFDGCTSPVATATVS